ncbi:MAG: DoxX family protein [Burkholderiales bacterium]|nr:DoxX family protein [Flavobacterium sp.]
MTHLQKIIKPIIMPYWWQEFLTALPRIICGYLLTSSFGADKFGLPWSAADQNLRLFEVVFWFPNDVASYGGIFKMFPVFFAWMGAFSEAVGGLFLFIGFQTRIASFLVMSAMLVAIFMQQIGEGIWNCLPAMGILWVSLFGLVLGSGRFGLDYLLTKKLI